MNSDEIKSLIVKILLIVLSPYAAKLHTDGATLQAIAVDLTDAGVLIFGIYDHWNQKKVPENSTAILLPGGPKAVGTIDLAPLSGLAKIVG